jgi:hypothetical protein
MPDAIVTLTVTAFNSANNCFTATAAITNSGAGNRVYMKSGDPTVYIKSKGKTALNIQFLVVCPPAPAPQFTYTVTGITFSQQTSDPSGAATFTSRAASGNGITFNDTFAAQPNWSYTIAITRSDGQTGQIDPGITNTDE